MASNEELEKLKQDMVRILKDVDRSKLEGILKEVKKQNILQMREKDGYTPNEYFGLDIACIAYTHILETESTPQEAMEYAVKHYDDPKEFVEKTKNKKFYYAKEVVTAHKQHPQQVKMVEQKVIRLSDMRRHNTLNSQLNSLYQSKQVSDRLDDLERRVSSLEHSNKESEAKLDHLLSMHREEIKTQKDVAYHLYQQGHDISYVMSELGVPQSTLYRWWKDFRQKPLPKGE